MNATGDRSVASRDIALVPDGVSIPNEMTGPLLTLLLDSYRQLPQEDIPLEMRQLLYGLSLAAYGDQL